MSDPRKAVRHTPSQGRGTMVRKKPKNAKKTLGRILQYTLGYKVHLVLIILAITGSSLSTVAGTYFLKPILNDYIIPLIGHDDPDLSGFVSILLILGSVYLFGIICTYAYNRLMLNVSTGTLWRVRVDLFTHMQDLPIKYFDTHTHGDLMSRFTNDVGTLREMLGQGIPQLISSIISVVGVFVMMLILSPVLTLLVIVMFFILVFIVKTIGGNSVKHFTRQQKELGRVNGFIEEIIEGQKVVKVFNHEDNVKEEFGNMNEELFNAASSAHTFASILMPITGNFSYIHYALTAAIGAILAINGYLDIGTIGSFLQYTRSFSRPITQVSQQLNSVLTALAGAERIFDLIDEEPESDDGYVTLVFANKDDAGNLSESVHLTGTWAWKQPHQDGTVTYTEVLGDVRFENVSFGYDPNKTVLDGISLFAKPGQRIAFVGSTGAGKTTITNLINRFYDIQEGIILYDGIDVKEIRKADLRRSLSIVLQDTHLFTGTVMENIRYGNLNASDEDVINAAKLANAHFFITHLPQGYQTLLTADGSNLSQGQRQLISIARATVANPPVLILDEATSSIDTRTEALIEKGMDTLMEGRTVFVIAHRLSTVINSNAILVLENGKIIERGDHDDLIEQRGKYYQLYTGLFELT